MRNKSEMFDALTMNQLASSFKWGTYVHHDDVIKWKHFPHYWPFVSGIHRSPVHSPRLRKPVTRLVLWTIVVSGNGLSSVRCQVFTGPSYLWLFQYIAIEPLATNVCNTWKIMSYFSSNISWNYRLLNVNHFIQWLYLLSVFHKEFR